MKKIIIIMCFIKFCYAADTIIVDEALLLTCQSIGHDLYNTCVVTPPADPAQEAVCAGLYGSYLSCSATLTAPQTMMLSSDPDPYTSSPFDPCKFEVNHQILFDICPTLPTPN